MTRTAADPDFHGIVSAISRFGAVCRGPGKVILTPVAKRSTIRYAVMSLHNQQTRCSLITAVTVLTVVAFGFVRPVPANGAPHAKRPDAKQQVEALEEHWRVAQLAGDTETMGKMLSDDYLGISMSGEVDTKGQQLRRVADRRIALTKIELSDMKVKLIGTIAIVTSQAQVEGTSDGASIKGTYRYTRIYHRLPSGQWKITSFEATREHKSRRNVEAQNGTPIKEDAFPDQVPR